MSNLHFRDDCINISEEMWARIEKATREAVLDLMIYGTYPPPQRHQNVSMSAVVADTGGSALPKGLRFAALGALLPTSPGSTTTD